MRLSCSLSPFSPSGRCIAGVRRWYYGQHLWRIRIAGAVGLVLMWVVRRRSPPPGINYGDRSFAQFLPAEQSDPDPDHYDRLGTTFIVRSIWSGTCLSTGSLSLRPGNQGICAFRYFTVPSRCCAATML